MYLIESYWAASIAVMDQPAPLHGPPIMESLFQSVQNEAGMRRPAHPPADDPSRIGVDDKGDIDGARPGRDAGQVGDPQHVRRRGMELAISVIERARCGLVAHRGADRLAADDALKTHGPHQWGNRAAGDVEPSRCNSRQTLRTP